MGASQLAVFLLAAVAQTPTPDSTSPYSTPAVQHLVERAMLRRRAGDSAVSDYRSRIHYRLTVGVGRRRWARVPASAVVVPFRAVTTFEEFAINTGRPIPFALPLPATDDPDTLRVMREARRDSLRAERRGGARGGSDSLRSWSYADRWTGGRYELHRPSNDSLAQFHRWLDSLSLDADPGEARRASESESELARLAESLPDSLTGRQAHGIAYQRLTDALRYDRVQGLSFGLGYRVRLPGVGFTDVYGTGRYGLSDDRVTGRISIIRDAPDGRLVVSGYREVTNIDPFAPAPGFGNTLNALLVAHDDGDYALVHGGSAGYETSLRTGLELAVGARYERQTSVVREATSEANDFLGGSGVLPPNPEVDQGSLVCGQVRLSGTGDFRWHATADVLGGEGTTTGRVYGEVRHGIGKRRGLTVRLKGGMATAPTLRQAAFRLGGVGTVRGHQYGARRGQAFWAAQLDLAPLPGRLRPVLFVDAGQAGGAGSLFSGRVLTGAGAGLSLFSGLLRFDLSRSLSPDEATLRFDIVVQAAR